MAPKVKAKAKANTKPSYFGAKNLPSVDFVDELAAERATRHADADVNEAPPMKKHLPLGCAHPQPARVHGKLAAQR
jgi:hypothetical protein